MDMYDVSLAKSGAQNLYDADRLGDDVVAVIDRLHLQRPILAGHSIAGAELSSVGSRFPKKLAGLIYLECLFTGYSYHEGRNDTPQAAADRPYPVQSGHKPDSGVLPTLVAGWRNYNLIPLPILAISAIPHQVLPPLSDDPVKARKFEENDSRWGDRLDQIDHALPKVTDIRIPHASHYIFRSNEAEVLKAIDAFAQDLPE